MNILPQPVQKLPHLIGILFLDDIPQVIELAAYFFDLLEGEGTEHNLGQQKIIPERFLRRLPLRAATVGQRGAGELPGERRRAPTAGRHRTTGQKRRMPVHRMGRHLWRGCRVGTGGLQVQGHW